MAVCERCEAPVDSHPLKVWDAEEDLHHRAQVASVAQVFDARVTRTKHRLQLHARLLDHLPFIEPRPGVVVCVVSVLHLRGGGRKLSVKLSLKHFWCLCWRARRLTLLCICSMSIPKCDKWSDMWGSNTASSSSNE